MKKLVLLLIFTSLLHSCSSDSNGSNNNNNISNTIPIGTTVKLEASISGGNTIAVVQYKDGQGNLISLSNVPNNWSTTYQVTTSIPNIFLQVNNGSISLSTGKIYINGVLKKNATANLVTLYYP
jgi:hypothetical protein